eukprot:5818200-Alexandrium_andersonii.AAC.1
MSASLVGSEMCIRDRERTSWMRRQSHGTPRPRLGTTTGALAPKGEAPTAARHSSGLWARTRAFLIEHA